MCQLIWPSHSHLSPRLINKHIFKQFSFFSCIKKLSYQIWVELNREYWYIPSMYIWKYVITFNNIIIIIYYLL